MKRISAGEFKAKCLSLMDQVQESGEEITITKHGKPVARLVPAFEEKSRRALGCREGTLEILGDLVSPSGEKWDAED